MSLWSFQGPRMLSSTPFTKAADPHAAGRRSLKAQQRADYVDESRRCSRRTLILDGRSHHRHPTAAPKGVPRRAAKQAEQPPE